MKDLTAKDGAEKVMKSDDLWATQPVLLLVLRRPGCVLCRGESRSLWDKKEEIQKLNMRMVCLLHEAIPEEVKDFWPEFWYAAALQTRLSMPAGLMPVQRGRQLCREITTANIIQGWGALFGYREDAVQGSGQRQVETR